MPTVDFIRRLTIQATTQGVEQSAASLNKLAQAEEGVAVASEKMTKVTASAEKNLQALQRRYDQEARAAQDLKKVQEGLALARQQGLISQNQSAALMQKAIAFHNSSAAAAKQHGDALAGLGRAFGQAGAELGTFTASAGAVGRVLAALGPAGAAAAAAIGALAGQWAIAAKAGLALADTSGKLVDLADSLGITVEALQALQQAASQVGVSNEQLDTSLSRFAVTLGKVREGEQSAVEAFERLGQGFSEIVRGAETTEDALGLILDQLTKLDPITKALATREIFGKGGLGLGRLADEVGAGGGLTKFIEGLGKINIISDEAARSFDKLGDKINQNMTLAARQIQLAFGAQNLPIFAQISEDVLSMSGSFRRLAEDIQLPFSGAVLAAVGALRDALSDLADAFEIGDISGFQRALENLIPPRAAAAIVEFIRLLKLLFDAITSIPSAALSMANSLRSLDFAGALATAQSFGAQLGAIGDQASEVARVFSSEFNPQFENAGRVAANTEESLRASESGMQGVAQESDNAAKGAAKLPPALNAAAAGSDKLGKSLKETNTVMNELGQIAGQLGSALVSAFLRGESAGRALKSTLQSISSQATGSAITNLIQGNFAQAGIGGAIGLGAGLLSFLFGDDEEDRANQEELARQQRESAELVARVTQTWADLNDELLQFEATGQGLVRGTLAQAIEQIAATAKTLGDAAAAAGSFEGALRVATAAQNNLNRVLGEFYEQLPTAVAEFGKLSTPMTDARNSVDALMTAFKVLSADITTFGLTVGADLSPVMAELTANARTAALGLLDIVDPVNELVVTAETLRARAVVLKETLVELGFTAEEAAVIVDQRLNASLQKLANNFLDPIIRQINEFVGGGWINEATDLLKQVQQLHADAAALGIQTNLINQFLVLSAQDIINRNELVGRNFQILARMLGIAESELRQFNAVIEETGDVVEETADVVARSLEEIADAIQRNEDRLFLALHRSDSLADQLARFDLAAQREREAEIKAGGQALASLEAALAQERLNIILDFQAKALQEAQRAAEEQARIRQQQIEAEQRAAEERARILEEATEFLAGALRRIQDFVNSFLAGPGSILPPSQQLATAQQAFATRLAEARAGSREALTGLTTQAQELIDATRRYFGSSAPGVAIIQNMLAELAGLSELTPEQFIVDNLRPPIEDISDTVTDVTDVQTQVLAALLENLRLAIQSNDAQAIAIALLPLFQQLDTTMDQALSFAEFQAGLSGMASDAQLQQIFNLLDTNHDQLLQKEELIRIATAGTELNTGTTNTRMATNNDLLQQLVGLTNVGGAQYEVLIAILIGLNRMEVIEDHMRGFLNVIANWAPGSSHAMGGLLSGPLHSAGGIPIGPGHFAEGGEYIMSRRAVGALGVGTLDQMNFGVAANDNNIFAAIKNLERSLLRGIKALMDTQLEAAGIITQPMREANKLTRTRRGEKKVA